MVRSDAMEPFNRDEHSIMIERSYADEGSCSVKNEESFVKPIESLTDQFIGSIKLDDQRLIEDIIESDD
jgi:hypothetical protein